MALTLLTILATMSTMAGAIPGQAHISFLRTKASSGSCTCKKWKETYANGVECGSNAEFFLASGKTKLPRQELREAKVYLGDEFCTRFYETLDDNYCVNINMGADEGEWCYVDSACSSLNGGERTVEGVSWKKCQHEQDKMLRDYSPEELAELATKANLDLGLLHKMSYPLYKGHLWKDVSGFWNVPVTAVSSVPQSFQQYFPSPKELQDWLESRWGDGSITPELRQEMQLIKDSGKPYSFDMDLDNHPPHVIVEGDKVFLVFEELICVSGC